MLDALRGRGVDTTGCLVDASVPTGFSVILSQPADRAILTYPGSIARLRLGDVDPSMLRRARHLHVGGYFLLEALRPDLPELFGRAKAHGLSTSLDTNWDPSGRWDAGLEKLWPVCDVFLPNEQELLNIAGQREFGAALETLSARIPTIAVKAGARGGVARHAGQTVTAAPLEIDVVDTTGAGDSFDAGFLYGYLSGKSLEESLRLACACGSLSARGVGGTERQPTLPEVEQALAIAE